MPRLPASYAIRIIGELNETVKEQGIKRDYFLK